MECMLPVFLILYGAEDDQYDTSRYDTTVGANTGAYDGYTAGDSGERYLTALYNGTDSYLDLLFGDDSADDGYAQQEHDRPYTDTGDVDRYSGPTVITVVYEEMYEPDYRVFAL